MRLYQIVSVLLISIVLFSCNSKKSKTTVHQLEISEPFEITYSEGGGITGQVQSYHINSSGLIEYFIKMPGESDSLVWSRQVATEKLAHLQNSLTSSSILNESIQSSGNMTSSLTYATADTSYNFSWAGVGSMSDAPADMKKWISQLKLVLESND